jgi:hypothetical protein
MNLRFMASLPLLALFAATPVQATYVQNLGGFHCDESLDANLGDAFSVACSGNLTIDPSSLIRAESISITAAGTITVGNLEQRSQTDFGSWSLFSIDRGRTANFAQGSADSAGLIPGSVIMVSPSGSGIGTLTLSSQNGVVFPHDTLITPRTGGQIVLGAPGTIVIQGVGRDGTTPIGSSGPALSVPEPHSLALMGSGIALLVAFAWTRQRRGHAHA